ncbi:hypothetical protein V6N13_124295 [Hibiscus sabdariffa]|uniref:Uncharacterized protein n=1 Tax=Hibiscus sabdariffa TaxID=183260 RepID=A0ABR2S1F5_9ROSI
MATTGRSTTAAEVTATPTQPKLKAPLRPNNPQQRQWLKHYRQPFMVTTTHSSPTIQTHHSTPQPPYVHYKTPPTRLSPSEGHGFKTHKCSSIGGDEDLNGDWVECEEGWVLVGRK